MGRTKQRLSWSHISKVLSGAVNKVEAFRPSVLLAVSSASAGPRSGGSIPALMLRASLHHDGCKDVSVHHLSLSRSGSKDNLFSWAPQQLSGARVLLVEKVDDSRRTLSAAVAEVERVFAAAAVAAAGDPSWQAPSLGVFVLSNKRRVKAAQLPDALLNSYFAGEELDDGNYEYPWDCEDEPYMASWRGACAATAGATSAGRADGALDMQSDDEAVEPYIDEDSEQAEAVAVAAVQPGAEAVSWRQSLGPAFIAAWRAGCAGFDADQRALAVLLEQQQPTWQQQLGDEYIRTHRAACGVAMDTVAPAWRTTLRPTAVAGAAVPPTPSAASRAALGPALMAAWRGACAGPQQAAPAAEVPATWQQQVCNSYIAAQRAACGGSAPAAVLVASCAQPQPEPVSAVEGCNTLRAQVAQQYMSAYRSACV